MPPQKKKESIKTKIYDLFLEEGIKSISYARNRSFTINSKKMEIKTHIAIVTSITILGYFSFAIAQEQTNQTTDWNSVLKLGEMGDKRAVKPLIASIKDKSKNS